jgi:CubicO group peptidase (beta-lactamase class C family)
MITAVALAQLVSQGKLAYEDAVSKFVPAPEGSPFTKIRIKNLLAHTSGMSMWWSADAPALLRPERSPSADTILAYAVKEKSEFEPGSRYQYSNLGFVVLGAVIEKASGRSYADYVRENIYQPAGMENGDPPKDPTRATWAVGYAKTFDENGKTVFHPNQALSAHPDPEPGGSAGGGYATAADLLKFDRALRLGKLLANEEVQRLLTPKPELGSTEYGYGFDVDVARDTAGHSGGTTGVSNNFEMFLRSGWTAIVMSNYTEGTFEMCEPVVLKIRELLDVRR